MTKLRGVVGKFVLGVEIGSILLMDGCNMSPRAISLNEERELKQTITEGVNRRGLDYLTADKAPGTSESYYIYFHNEEEKMIGDYEVVMPIAVEKHGKTDWYTIRVRDRELISMKRGKMRNAGGAGGGCSCSSFSPRNKRHENQGIQVPDNQEIQKVEQPRNNRDYNKAQEVKGRGFGLWEKGVVPYSYLDEITGRMETFIENTYSIPEIEQTKHMFRYNPRLTAAGLQVLCEKGLETKIQQFYPKDFNNDGTEDLAILVEGQVIFLKSRGDGFQINRFYIKDPQCEYTPRWDLGETQVKFDSEAELATLDKLNAKSQISAGWGSNAPDNINEVSYCVTLKEGVWVNGRLKPVALDWFYTARDNQYYRLQAVLNPSGICRTPSCTFGGINTMEEIADELVR